MCRVQKIFRRLEHKGEITKLTDKENRGICKDVVDDGDYDKLWISRDYGVSVRRVEQLVKIYRDAGDDDTKSK